MRFQRGLSGLSALVSLLAVLTVTATAGATIEKRGEWPAEDKKISLDIDHVGQEEAIKRLAAEAGWSVIEPILDIWQALPPRSFPNYAAGSYGPKEADELLAREGREWRKLDE